MSPQPHRDETTLNLELRERIELARLGSLQPTDLEADIALFEDWLEPTPTIRTRPIAREWLEQSRLTDVM
jgi:hypothetical protein